MKTQTGFTSAFGTALSQAPIAVQGFRTTPVAEVGTEACGEQAFPTFAGESLRGFCTKTLTASRVGLPPRCVLGTLGLFATSFALLAAVATARGRSETSSPPAVADERRPNCHWDDDDHGPVHEVVDADQSNGTGGFWRTVTTASAAPPPRAAADKVNARDYFVSLEGNDANPGTWARPFRTIQHAANLVKPGDAVHIRGGVYREKIHIARSGEPGKPITFRSYCGEEVRIGFAKDMSQPAAWTLMGSNRWHSAAGSFDARTVNHDVATLWHDGRSHWRYKKYRSEDLAAQWDFWHNQEQGRIDVWSADNPAKLAKSLEVPLAPVHTNGWIQQFVLSMSAAHLVFDGLRVNYANVHGVGIRSSHHIIFRNGAIVCGGGGNVTPNHWPPVRWGDGLDIWESSHDIVFENNDIGEFPDGGLTNQGFKGEQRNIVFRRNRIFNCTNGIHCWFGGDPPGTKSLRDILYEQNTFEDIGRGWFEDQGVMQGAIQVVPRREVEVVNFVIRSNTFVRCGTTRFAGGDWRGVNGAINVAGGEVHLDCNIVRDGPSEGIHIYNNGLPFTGRVVNNLIYSNAWSGLRVARNAVTDQAVFANNTFVNNGDTTHPNVWVQNGSLQTVWRNNIFYSRCSTPLAQAAGMFDYNCHFPNSGPGGHSANRDPLFLDVGSADYRLAPESPCRDAGITAHSPPTDLTGQPRPMGTGIDLGAYELPVQ
ncbi:MAG: DUF1565 domain-containing protein [Verrucomicrobia bacterium]|nr:DUF1565 domain-containing protein [Verrucomicrobiota bacterium]